jgi:hypothetical protein
MKLTSAMTAAACLVALLAGCNRQQSQPAQPQPAATPAPAAVLPAPKADPVKAEDLQAGLALMQPRLTRTVEGAAKIEMMPSFRYLFHPKLEGDALMEFDTRGLASLSLSPYMVDLGIQPICQNDPKAGVVQSSWALDDGPLNSLTVDRNYTQLVPVEIGGAKRLVLHVGNGNGVITCDWFSVGFVDVKASSP